MDVQTVAALAGIASLVGSAAVAVGLYVVRNEARQQVQVVEVRIARHEAECEQRNRNADERHDALTDKLDHMDAKLDRLIEARR